MQRIKQLLNQLDTTKSDFLPVHSKSTSGRKIVICGGGNAAHVFTALAASNPTNEVHLLSLYKTEAADFQTELNKTKDKLLTIEKTQENIEIKAAPFNITNNSKCLNNSDIVIISLPAFAHNQYLNAIKSNIYPTENKKCLVAVFPGASGLECEWQSIFGSNNNYFILLSCITMPWAARILQFGQKAEILGTKHQIEVSIKKSDKFENNQTYINMITDIIGTQPIIIDNGHILNMSLSAINAIVHPPIMYAQWKDYNGEILAEKPLFYQGITESGAQLLSDLSYEVINIIKCVEMETGLKLETQHIYDWFVQCYGKECTNTSNLRQCILTNPGYNGLTHPCLKVENGYIPHFKYRYLSEDRYLSRKYTFNYEKKMNLLIAR